LGLASCVVLLAMAGGPATGQEMRPTLDKINETGDVQLGREMSRPFSFLGSDARPTGPKPANARCNAAGASLPTEPSLHPRTLVFQHPAS
jgi:hypothetical protein